MNLRLNPTYLMTFLFTLITLIFTSSCQKDNDLFVDAVNKNIEEQIIEDASNSQNNDSGSDSDQPTGDGPLNMPDDPFSSNLKAFPTAFGAGAYVTGGRGKPVYKVTNLNDSGPGSFRQAISNARSTNGGIITFDVSGVINLQSWLTIEVSNLTIAGQTAPKGGITITGTRFRAQKLDNFIMRYIRIRPRYTGEDAFELIDASNVMLDHVSVSWGGDETISIRGFSDNITFQRIIVSEGKTGSLFGDSDSPEKSENLSFLSSLFFNISHRTPNVSSNGRADVINNVVQDWQYRLTRTKGAVQLNHINNYYAMGDKTSLNTSENAAVESGNPRIYTAGNFVDKGFLTDPNADNWFLWKEFDSGIMDTPLSRQYQVTSQYPLLGEPMPILSAIDAYYDVIGDVGCNKYISNNLSIENGSDTIDNDYFIVLDGRKEGSFDYYKMDSNGETFTSEARYVSFQSNISSTPIASRPMNWDSDNDGMPDVWEIEKGLNPDLDDSSGDQDGDGYTNIEEYLNIVDL